MTSDLQPSAPAGAKRAQHLAATIEAEIAQRGWPIGEVLGSETALRDRFGVSRAVLREAIRILENHGVAEMRKGRGGGLTVRRPEITTLARAAALHLDYERATLDHVVDARLALESANLELVLSHLDDGGRVALTSHMQSEHATLATTGFAAHAHAFHRLLARLSHNPVLVMCTEMLLDVQQRRQRSIWPDERVPTRFSERSVVAHQHIVDALVAGDANAARAALCAHLGGLSQGRATSLCQDPRSLPDDQSAL
ncbi:MAG: FadR family transcriptional regulator [Acidimicrobiales bacterium]|nr:FadR family transcriptional regulator [Acidimicrobiales bacterium]